MTVQQYKEFLKSIELSETLIPDWVEDPFLESESGIQLLNIEIARKTGLSFIKITQLCMESNHSYLNENQMS